LQAVVDVEDELLEEEELDLLLEDDDVDELEALLVEEELLDDAAGPTEHQAESEKALPPVNCDWEQVKLPVSVAYTKTPDLPRATVCVPVMVQVLPTCAHFV
jgi:hypothetical protein